MSLSQRHSFSKRERERKKEGAGNVRRLLDHPSAQVVGSPGEGRAAGRRAGESGKVRVVGMGATGADRGLAGQQGGPRWLSSPEHTICSHHKAWGSGPQRTVPGLWTHQ